MSFTPCTSVFLIIKKNIGSDTKIAKFLLLSS